MRSSFQTFLFACLFMVMASGLAAQWTPLTVNNNHSFSDVEFPSASTGFLTTQNGVHIAAPLYKTTNGGITWDSIAYTIPTGFVADLEAIQFVDVNNGYLVGNYIDSSMVFPIQESFLLKTTDGGTTWADVTPTNDLNDPNIYFSSPTEGVIEGVEDFYRTTDGGQTWTQSVMFNKSALTMSFGDAATGFMGGFDLSQSPAGWLAKTTDAGVTWNQVSTTTNGFTLIRSSYFLDADKGYVIGENPFSLLRTVDGGLTWTETPFSLGYGENLWFINDSTGFITEGHEIYKTTDYGLTWTLELEDPQMRYIQALFFEGNIGYATGQQGLIYTIDLSTSRREPVVVQELNLFPNPIAANGSLNLELPGGSGGVVQLFDLTGKVVFQQDFSSQAVQNSIELHKYRAAPGTYIVMIELTDGTLGRQKLVITAQE